MRGGGSDMDVGDTGYRVSAAVHRWSEKGQSKGNASEEEA